MTNHLSSKPSQLALAGLFVVGSVVLLAYAPAFKMGFRLLDDYTYLHWAASMPLPQYLAHFLDPSLQTLVYRPFSRIFLLIEYHLFHFEPSYYYLVKILIHLANSLLVFGIVRRVAGRWRTAFLSAVLYGSAPVVSEAVFWISDEYPLATLFSLAAVFYWVIHLQCRDRRSYLLAIGSLILGLLSKESAAVVPIVFLLVDRLLVRNRIGILELVHRYLPIALVMIAFLGIEYGIQRQGLFIVTRSYAFGPHMVSNYAAYLAMLFFPWGSPYPFDDLTLFVAGLVFIGIAILKRSIELICLVVMIFLAIGPIVSSAQGAYSRYLYLAAIPVLILWAIASETIWSRWGSRGIGITILIALASVVTLNVSNTADAAAAFSESLRRQRVPFRDIVRQHPTFPPNTRLFFVEAPYNPPMTDVAGMFFQYYGANVSVTGTFEDGRPYVDGILKPERARLRDYAPAYVYYFEENNRPVEIAVEKEAKILAMPQAPIDFEEPIRLEGFEATSSTINQGQPLVLILYWRATGRIEKDYTMFVHFVDANGELLVGSDSMPRNGQERTSRWRTSQFTADAHVISIPQGVAVGNNYRLEVGLYYLPTQERLSMVDDRGFPFADKVVIAPFNVVR